MLTVSQIKYFDYFCSAEKGASPKQGATESRGEGQSECKAGGRGEGQSECKAGSGGGSERVSKVDNKSANRKEYK